MLYSVSGPHRHKFKVVAVKRDEGGKNVGYNLSQVVAFVLLHLEHVDVVEQVLKAAQQGILLSQQKRPPNRYLLALVERVQQLCKITNSPQFQCCLRDA